MKKLSFFFAALLVSAMVLTSCAGSGSEAKNDSKADSKPAVETPAPAVVDTPAVDSPAAPAAK